jgi:integrase
MPKITKALVDSITATGADRFIWDEGKGALTGFGIRVKASGVASYLIQYRTAAGATRRMVLGRVGVLTPTQARDRAFDKLAEVSKGGDPSEARHEARRFMTIGELCDWYLAEAEAGRILGRSGHPIKASTLAMDRSRIKTHVKPLIGHRPASWLTIERMGEFQNDIAEGKTAKARPEKGRTGTTTGGRGVASRTVRMLNAILAHGQRKGKGCAPARGVRCFADKKVEVFLSLPELTCLGASMRKAAAEGASRIGLAAIRALLLTGCRKMEICALPRDRFNGPAKCLQLADSKSVRVRPLGEAAIEHLAAQPRTDSPFLFPSDKGDGHLTDPQGLIDKLLTAAKIDKHVTPHVFRHTYGAVATGLGYSELIIKALIGHSKRGATQLYAHVPDPAALSAADRVSAAIADALDGIAAATEAPIAAPAAPAAHVS